MATADQLAEALARLGFRPHVKARVGRVVMRARERRVTSRPRGGGAAAPGNDVDAYWTAHTVHDAPFVTARQSARYLEKRFAEYPLFREFSGLYGPHEDEVVLDYGCGPGNDLVGFAMWSAARRIVGIDVSETAIRLAHHRLSLHGIDEQRVGIVQLSDTGTALPFDDATFDFLSSQGVLHHTSEPEAILGELHRVLRPGGEGTIMVYNRDSVWMHLHVAWELLVRDGRWPGLSAEEAFPRSTDGEECPISRCYSGEEFVSLLEAAGFEARYLGGYLSQIELRAMQESWASAIADERLTDEHRDFLRSLRYDYNHRPMFGDLHAGIGGSYRIRKPA